MNVDQIFVFYIDIDVIYEFNNKDVKFFYTSYINITLKVLTI